MSAPCSRQQVVLPRRSTAYKQAMQVNQTLVDGNPAVNRFQNELSWCHSHIGSALEATGKTTEALEAYEAVRDINLKLADANPTVLQFQRELALNLSSISSNLHSRSGKAAEALEAAKRPLDRFARGWSTQTRPWSNFKSNLARSHTNIAVMHYEAGRMVEALEAFEAARRIDQKLADAHPDVTEFQSMAATPSPTSHTLSPVWADGTRRWPPTSGRWRSDGSSPTQTPRSPASRAC